MKRIPATILTVLFLLSFLGIASANTQNNKQKLPTITFEELQRKATEGDTNAQITLGSLYYAGEGVEKDYNEAFKWTTKAAEHGNPYAQFNLALMYYNEETKNYEKSLKWFKKAAKQGLPDAQYILGKAYYSGDELIRNYKDWSTLFNNYRNYKEGLRWMQKAAEQGFSDAPQKLEEMKKLWQYRSTSGYIICDEACLAAEKDSERAELFQNIVLGAVLLLILAFIGFIFYCLIRLIRKTSWKNFILGHTAKHTNINVDKRLFIFVICLLGVGILPLPIGYYQMLRFIVCGTSIYAIVKLINNQQNNLIYPLGIIAVVYNPIFQLIFSKGLWIAVDIITIWFFWRFLTRGNKKETVSATEDAKK